MRYLRIASSASPRMAWLLSYRELRRRWCSDGWAYGLGYDLTRALEIEEPRIPVQVRELAARDVPRILSFDPQNIDTAEFRYMVICRLLIEAGLPTCYVCVDSEDTPCSLCWLVRASDSRRFQTLLGNGSVALQPGEVLCENIFTRRDYRGNGLMKYLTLKLFEKARQDGANRAITFVAAEKTMPLTKALAIGWEPCLLKRIRWRFFRARILVEAYHENGENYLAA